MMKTDGSTTVASNNGLASLTTSSLSSSVSSSSSPTTWSASQSHSQSRSEIGRLADAFRMYVDVRDRKYHSKTYKDCFIGSEAVDALVYTGVAKTRQDALRVGWYLQNELRLFSHVKDNHDFKDDYLFYKFNNNNNNNNGMGMMMMTSIGVDNIDDHESRTTTSPKLQHHPIFSDLEEKAKIFYQLADVQDRTYRFKKYWRVFVGSEIIDRMVYHGLAKTRWEATQLGRAMATHLDLFEHVDKKHTFADGNFFFKFTNGVLKLIRKIGIDDDTDKYGPGDIALNSGHTADLSDHSSSSTADTPPKRSTVDTAVVKTMTTKATKQRKQFKYPEPLPSLIEFSEDSIKSGSSSTASIEAPPSTTAAVVEPYQKQRQIINILKNSYSNDLIDEWQVVLSELKSELTSVYTGHHKIIESSPSGSVSTLRTDKPTSNKVFTHAKKRLSTSSDSITTVNYDTTASPRNDKEELLKSFDTFDSIIQKNSTLYDDGDTSVWTEYIVEEEDKSQINNRTTNGMILPDDVSYMEFTILEEATVDLSYIEESVVVGNQQPCHQQSPTTVLTTPVTAAETPEQNHQLPHSCSKAIFVQTTPKDDGGDDDDMTAITLDPFFADSKKTKTNKKPHASSLPDSRSSTSNVLSSVARTSQEQGSKGDEVNTTTTIATTKKQQINTILRKHLWSADEEDSVVHSLDILCDEVKTFPMFIVQCGGIMAVLRSMDTYPLNESIQYLGCTILKDLVTVTTTTDGSSSETNKATINELDGISVVAQAMRLHPHSGRVKDVARRALSVFL